MNTTIESINLRRSIRSYENKQLTDEQLQTLLDSAFHAPSGKNMQPWFFSVIQNKELIDEISNAFMTLPASNDFIKHLQSKSDYHVLHNAPTVIVVCYDPSEGKWGAFDSSFAAQNICLAAEAIGLGTCIVGLVRPILEDTQSPLFKKLQIPEGYKSAYAITVGIPKGEKPAANPRDMGKYSIIK